MPSIPKEIVIERAVQGLPPDEVRCDGWLEREEVTVVPCTFAFTVKPPDPQAEGVAPDAALAGQGFYKRKAWLLVATTRHRLRNVRFWPLLYRAKLQEVLVFRFPRCHLSFSVDPYP